MAKSSKKKSVSRASKASASKKKTVKKKAIKKKAVAKKTAKKKTTKAKAAPKKKTATKKAVSKKKTVKKAASKKSAAKKKTVKKPAAKTTKKKAAAKKAPAKKPAAKKAGVKKAPIKKKSAPKKAFKPPAVPYASIAEARPTVGYNPHTHEAPTPAQLRRIKTGLAAKDLRYFRQLLLGRRAEIIGDVQGLEAARSGNAGEISHMPLHMADVGSDNYEQEFMLGLMESERKIILQIDEALMRIQDKTYGVCLETAVPIGRPRLEAKPWAKYCIEVARERERFGLR